LGSDDKVLWPKRYIFELHKGPELFIEQHSNHSFNNESVLSWTLACYSTLPLYWWVLLRAFACAQLVTNVLHSSYRTWSPFTYGVS
jgi:hypothetical protein